MLVDSASMKIARLLRPYGRPHFTLEQRTQLRARQPLPKGSGDAEELPTAAVEDDPPQVTLRPPGAKQGEGHAAHSCGFGLECTERNVNRAP